MAVFCGGLAQLLAGMWEFPSGNMFGATGAFSFLIFSPISPLTHISRVAFTSYGAFWMSFATILIPGSGIVSAYTSPDEFASALGIYLITWFIFTFLLTFVLSLLCESLLTFSSYNRIVTLRKSVAFIMLFSLLSITFAVLAAGQFSGKAMYVYPLFCYLRTSAPSQLHTYYSIGKAGGYFGVATALVAYYIGLSQLLASEKNALFSLPLGTFSD